MKRGFSAIIVIFIILGALLTIALVGDLVVVPKVREKQSEAIVQALKKNMHQDTKPLVFLTSGDQEEIINAIDRSTTVVEFQKNLFNAYDDVLRRYNKAETSVDDYLSGPEFLVDNPESIEITSKGETTDYLQGLKLKPITNADLPELKAFGRLFVLETARYPLSWMRQAMPAAFVFVKGLGVESHEEQLAGLENGIIVYDITPIKQDTEFTRETIHHEIWHWIEQKNGLAIDPRWPEAKEKYEENNVDLAGKDLFKSHPSPGYVSGYAKLNANEDKAETYSLLFTPTGQKELNRWTATDPVLKAKVAYLKNIIQERVKNMDDGFYLKYIN